MARPTDPAGQAGGLIREIIEFCNKNKSLRGLQAWGKRAYLAWDPASSLQGIYHLARKVERLFETLFASKFRARICDLAYVLLSTLISLEKRKWAAEGGGRGLNPLPK